MSRPPEHRAADLFAGAFGGRAEEAVRAPGRVNVIGDHTDYNNGFVLPIAIDRATSIAFRRRNDAFVRLVSEDGADAEFSLEALEHGEPSWAEYVRGVAWALGVTSETGWEGAVATDIPIGAGLASSAALELAAALVFESLGDGDREPRRLARAAQRAENDWVGMDCGIMDQLAVAAAKPGHALLIDCASLETRQVPIPGGVVFVVLDTSTRRELTASGYNERRATCEAAALSLGVESLRDVTLDALPEVEPSLDSIPLRRVRHVVSENARVLAAAEAMDHQDVVTLGRLMTESHHSLRDDFAVSTRELDAMVGAALAGPGCLGARVTGAGFGGCAVGLVETEALDAFTLSIRREYQAATGLIPEVYPTIPARGASMMAAPAVVRQRGGEK